VKGRFRVNNHTFNGGVLFNGGVFMLNANEERSGDDELLLIIRTQVREIEREGRTLQGCKFRDQMSNSRLSRQKRRTSMMEIPTL
jgi:hypothetical protein